jgi:hypothetical protein
LETVPLPSLDPIYFASTPQGMTDVLGQMHTGLAALRGGLVRIAVCAGTPRAKNNTTPEHFAMRPECFTTPSVGPV